MDIWLQTASFSAGTSIEEACIALVETAKRLQVNLQAKFNGVDIYVFCKKNSSAEKLYKEYLKELKRPENEPKMAFS